jgi:hypothetical protein
MSAGEMQHPLSKHHIASGINCMGLVVVDITQCSTSAGPHHTRHLHGLIASIYINVTTKYSQGRFLLHCATETPTVPGKSFEAETSARLDPNDGELSGQGNMGRAGEGQVSETRTRKAAIYNSTFPPGGGMHVVFFSPPASPMPFLLDVCNP